MYLVYILVHSTIKTDNCYIITQLSETVRPILKNEQIRIDDCINYLAFKKGICFSEKDNLQKKLEILSENYKYIKKAEPVQCSDYPENVIFGSVYSVSRLTYTVKNFDLTADYTFEKSDASDELREVLADEKINITDVNVYFTSADGRKASNVNLLQLSPENMAELGDNYHKSKNYLSAISCYLCALKYNISSDTVLHSVLNSYMALAKTDSAVNYYRIAKKIIDKYSSRFDYLFLNNSYLEIYLKINDYNNSIKYFDLLIYGNVSEEQKAHYALEKAEFLYKNQKYQECMDTIAGWKHIIEYFKNNPEMMQTYKNIERNRVDNLIFECEQELKKLSETNMEPEILPESAETETVSDVSETKLTEEKQEEKKVKSSKNKSKESRQTSVDVIPEETEKEYLLPSQMGIQNEFSSISFSEESEEPDIDERSLTNNIKRWFIINGRETDIFRKVVTSMILTKFFSADFLRKANASFLQDITAVEYIINHLYDMGLISRIKPDIESESENIYYYPNEKGRNYFASDKFKKIVKALNFPTNADSKYEISENIFSALRIEKIAKDIFLPLFEKYLSLSVRSLLSHFCMNIFAFKLEKINKYYMVSVVLVPLKAPETSAEEFTDDIRIIEKEINRFLPCTQRIKVIVCSENYGYEWITVLADAFDGVINRNSIFVVSEKEYINANGNAMDSSEMYNCIISTDAAPQTDESESTENEENIPVVTSEEAAENNLTEDSDETITEEISEPETSEPDISEQNNDIEDTDNYEEDEIYYSFMNDKSFINLTSEQINDDVKSMIRNENYGCALTYIKAVSEYDESYQPFYKVLSMAFDNPAEDCIYTSSEIYSIQENMSPVDEKLYEDCIIASELRAIYNNDCEYDYTINSFADNIKSSRISEEHSMLLDITDIFTDFRKEFGIGINAMADYCNGKGNIEEARLNEIIKRAESCYTTYVNSTESRTRLKVKVFKGKMFSEKNELMSDLKVVASNEKDSADKVADFVKKKFIKDKSEIISRNISDDKISEYILDIWDEADAYIKDHKKSISQTVELSGPIRTNCEVALRKIVTVMCDWLDCINKEDVPVSKAAENFFRKERDHMLDLLDSLIAETSRTSDVSNPVLRLVFSDIHERISGSYNAESRKYFFADFLRDNYVLLDSNGIPDISSTFYPLADFSIIERIKAHAAEPENSFNDRIKKIFVRNSSMNDYGSAIMINEYLAYNDAEDVQFSDYISNIDKYIEYSKGQASKLKTNFSEDLELASSQGKFHLRENLKDIMSTISSVWFEKCCESNNYGFYFRIIAALEKIIQEESLKREENIKQRFESIKARYEISEEDLKLIEDMTKNQNYTVVEDYMNQITEQGSINRFVDETPKYLEDFWKSYDNIYRKCTDSSVKLATALSKHKNKSTKGGIELIDSWLSNGSTGGIKKLETFLSKLGWKNCSAESAGKIGKDTEKYIIKMPKSKNSNYKHPIAVFGSGAENDGFNVLCIFGRADTGTLLDRFHEAGNTANTLVLLDYALTSTERRNLARKIKQDRTLSAVFAVVDRIVVTYLAENYAENNISRMLMSVIMPFTYYQPYVPESSNIMPAEMFTGRANLLSSIKSPSGVNIIYGGRQLGKSALLKMARKEIDFNENGDRAVIVDIDKMQIEEAARKVSEELVLRKIIDKVSEDWQEIGFMIKQRLMDEEKPEIPYLLLMLDEADKFISECGKVNYKPLAVLKDIQNIGENRFKFVVAGLRDIVKFDREIALGGNSIISHLRSDVVETFTRKEGHDLLVTALSYLGIYFEKSETILNILATTNCFPGLIHFYCLKLIEALSRDDYAGYSSVDTPPYIVTEKHIKKVLSDSEFQAQIKNKFEITLRSDELDNDRENGYNYYAAALVIAYLNFINKEKTGYSAEEIIRCSGDNLIKKLASMNKEKMSTILDELCSLGILIKDSDLYNFKFQSFCTMMGTKDEIEEKFFGYIE